MTKLIPWREALHPRNPFSGEFVHSMASSAPVTRNGLPSHLSRADMMLPLDEQLGKLLTLKSKASAAGDHALVASITNEELAVRMRHSQANLFKARPVAPWDIDKAAKKRDGDGDGFVNDAKNKRVAPVKRVGGVKRVAPKAPPKKKAGATTAEAKRIVAEIRGGHDTGSRQRRFKEEVMGVLGMKPQRKPAPRAGDAMSARLGRMGAKAPADGRMGEGTAARLAGRPKSPFKDNRGLKTIEEQRRLLNGEVKNSRGQWEDVGNRAERKMVEAEMAAGTKVPKGGRPKVVAGNSLKEAVRAGVRNITPNQNSGPTNNRSTDGKPGKAALPLDMNDNELADALHSPEHQAAAQAWADAMFHANAGDRGKFNAALGEFFRNDQQWDDDVRDVVDDWLDLQFGTPAELRSGKTTAWANKGLDNLGKWKVVIETERKKWKKANPVVVPAPQPTASPDLKNNAAYVHLKSGGSIADAPQDGLMEAIMAIPERFDKHPNGDTGVSPNWWIIDKKKKTDTEVSIPTPKLDADGNPVRDRQGKPVIEMKNTTNEVWVLKGTSSMGNLAGRRAFAIEDDVFNEQMGAFIQEAMGLQTPKTKWATRADAPQPYMAQQHFEQAIGGDKAVMGAKKVLQEADYNESKREIDSMLYAMDDKDQTFLDLLENPTQMMELPLFDFLINNTIDRHMGNWLVTVAQDSDSGNLKMNLAIIDNGYSFRGSSYRRGHINTYNRFNNGVNRFNNRLAALAMKNDKARMEAFVDQFAKRAAKIDLGAMRKKMEAGGLSDNQRKVMESEIAAMEERIKFLTDNAASIVQEMLK